MNQSCPPTVPIDFAEYLSNRPLAGLPDEASVTRQVEFDYDLVIDGRVVCCLDAIEITTIGSTKHVQVFEFHRRLYAPLATAKSARMLESLVSRSIPADIHTVTLVVSHGDPLASEIGFLWPYVFHWEFLDSAEVAP